MIALDWMYAACCYIGLELLAFVLVDVLAKSPLKEASTEHERRTIWLYESCGLLLLCILLYMLHHIPYILLTLTVITFVYTQVCGRADLGSFVANLRAHWENHLQHEESMKQIERQKQQQQQLQQQALGMAGLNHSTAAELNNVGAHNQDPSFAVNFPFFNKQGSLHYPPNATVVPGQDRPSYSMNPGYREAVKQSRGVYPVAGRNWNNAGNSFSSYTAFGANSFPMNSHSRGQVESFPPRIDSNERKSLLSNLQRRSLRHESPAGGLFARPLPSSSSSSSFKSKFMNVIGFRPSAPKPVGLVNNGQNMCFINSTLQCLARGPFIVECLTADAAKELEGTVAESELLSSLAEVLDILTIDPSSSDYKVFNASRFRKAVSLLNPTLVTQPGEPMRQQDVAEFLMWLLSTVHNILNKNRQALECDASGITNDERFSSPRLANLKLIYGDLNSKRIQDLKDQCRREIAVANGLENESYAEAIQRLSDLEWLTHKQTNDTVIDGLFTGQLVEAYHSLEHGHMSVALQAFNILPVPIAAPRFASGLVMLEDCFTNFCNIENLPDVPSGLSQHLRQDNGIFTGHANKEPLVQLSGAARRRNVGQGSTLGNTPVTRKPPHLSHLGGAYMPSPIHQSVLPSQPSSGSKSHPPPMSQTLLLSPSSSSPLGQNAAENSEFLDSNAFRTSTPIGCEAIIQKTAFAPRLQRRCLLRQLPECLIIQLMRFQYDQATRTPTKVNTSISVRLRNFNLRDVIYDTVTHRNDLTAQHGGYVYELYALCLHLGGNSTSHGHYVSYCLDGEKWYRMDDQDVMEVNMEYQLSTEEIRQNAYLLFYRKMNADAV
ncbi:endonuclease-reverse transcriptase [Plakobranchus ocellatus]|uniref:ubiquitinyl hydrolase 1 n=1 Tax=Plakobranchus ocellatus TaxID=259542 RepID=A0AAV4DIN4_9GAST|nr:endonuclease-reverse transcriptase [Plakobranchus ocellatus]